MLTELGAQFTKLPWYTLEYPTDKAINIHISNEHVTLMMERLKIDNIEYDDNLQLPNDINVNATCSQIALPTITSEKNVSIKYCDKHHIEFEFLDI